APQHVLHASDRFVVAGRRRVERGVVGSHVLDVVVAQLLAGGDLAADRERGGIDVLVLAGEPDSALSDDLHRLRRRVLALGQLELALLDRLGEDGGHAASLSQCGGSSSPIRTRYTSQRSSMANSTSATSRIVSV